MSNAKYDNVTQMTASGELNWAGDLIRAVLCQGATFDASHKALTDVMTPPAQTITSMLVNGRSLGPNGEALGMAVSYPRTFKDIEYQVILVKDQGRPEVPVVAFYDENEDGSPITLLNNGTLIVRPVGGDGITGTWFTF